MIRWRSASSPATSTPTTTRSPISAGASSGITSRCSSAVLQLTREVGVLKLGTMALDGTKTHANASRHSAFSYEHAQKIEAQLKEEVLQLAESADKASVPAGAARGAACEDCGCEGEDRSAHEGALRA
jgi:hypothetical protein